MDSHLYRVMQNAFRLADGGYITYGEARMRIAEAFGPETGQDSTSPPQGSLRDVVDRPPEEAVDMATTNSYFRKLGRRGLENTRRNGWPEGE